MNKGTGKWMSHRAMSMRAHGWAERRTDVEGDERLYPAWAAGAGALEGSHLRW